MNNGYNGTDVLRYCDLPDCPWHEPRPNCNMRRGNFLKYDGDQLLICVKQGFLYFITHYTSKCKS